MSIEDVVLAPDNINAFNPVFIMNCFIASLCCFIVIGIMSLVNLILEPDLFPCYRKREPTTLHMINMGNIVLTTMLYFSYGLHCQSWVFCVIAATVGCLCLPIDYLEYYKGTYSRTGALLWWFVSSLLFYISLWQRFKGLPLFPEGALFEVLLTVTSTFTFVYETWFFQPDNLTTAYYEEIHKAPPSNFIQHLALSTSINVNLRDSIKMLNEYWEFSKWSRDEESLVMPVFNTCLGSIFKSIGICLSSCAFLYLKFLFLNKILLPTRRNILDVGYAFGCFLMYELQAVSENQVILTISTQALKIKGVLLTLCYNKMIKLTARDEYDFVEDIQQIQRYVEDWQWRIIATMETLTLLLCLPEGSAYSVLFVLLMCGIMHWLQSCQEQQPNEQYLLNEDHQFYSSILEPDTTAELNRRYHYEGALTFMKLATPVIAVGIKKSNSVVLLLIFVEMQYKMLSIKFSQYNCFSRLAKYLLTAYPTMTVQRKGIESSTRVSFSKVTLNEDELYIENLSFDQGDLICVVGDNIQNNSVLLPALLGEVQLTGDLTTYGSIAYCPRDPWVFNTSLKENILMGHKFNELFYRRTLEACEVDESNPTTDEQKAKVSLARAVYSRADIFVIDDPILSKHIIKSVFNRKTGLLKDKCVIVCTGSKSLAKRATKIYMSSGQELIPISFDHMSSISAISTVAEDEVEDIMDVVFDSNDGFQIFRKASFETLQPVVSTFALPQLQDNVLDTLDPEIVSIDTALLLTALLCIISVGLSILEIISLIKHEQVRFQFYGLLAAVAGGIGMHCAGHLKVQDMTSERATDKIYQFIYGSLIVLVTLCVFFTVTPLATLIGLIILFITQHRCSMWFRCQINVDAQRHNFCLASVDGLSVIKAFTQQAWFMHRNLRLTQHEINIEASQVMAKRRMELGLSTSVALMILTATLLGIGRSSLFVALASAYLFNMTLVPLLMRPLFVFDGERHTV